MNIHHNGEGHYVRFAQKARKRYFGFSFRKGAVSLPKMASKRVLIVGGTGFVGRHLQAALTQQNMDFAVLSRSPHRQGYTWDIDARAVNPRALDNIDSVVYLAGASLLDRRLTPKRKAVCERSRIDGTQLIVETLRNAKIDLNHFISASAIGYYGSELTDTVKTELSTPGTDWAARLCADWERAALSAVTIAKNTTIVRFAPILGLDARCAASRFTNFYIRS